jgi:aspartyl-tRNA(Asn)/glutamyl-tRNA(Gln) amidotransferase subunit C
MIPYRTAAVNKKRVSQDPPGAAIGLAPLLPVPFLNPAAITEASHEMALTLSDVKRIAHLARIEVTDAEAGQALGQLNEIFKLIERLQSVDTSGIEPMSHPLGGSQRLRKDAASSTENREANMSNAPAQQDGLFLVPKVIE